jgi:hydroxymethylpyrimidine pyrophosphatase-like HAD family hydrolase
MTKQKYVVCDLDGTLCDHSKRLYLAWSGDWDDYNEGCFLDKINKQVYDFLWHQKRKNKVDFVFLTGRSEKHRSITENWLMSQMDLQESKYHLIMRPEGEYLAAPSFKLAALTTWRLKNSIMIDEIECAIDDNEDCVAMFKGLGIKRVIHYK